MESVFSTRRGRFCDNALRMATSQWLTREKLVAYLKLLAVAVVLTALPVIVFRMPEVQAWIFTQSESMRVSGALGIAAYLGICAIAGLFVLPFWIPGVVAGFVFGFPNGALIGFVGSFVSACVAFLTGRLFLRKRVSARLADNARWQRVEAAVRDTPRKIVFLMRALPLLPQNFLGYAFATTPVAFRDYALGTVGLLPLVLAYSYVGSLVKNVNELFAATSNRWLFIGIGAMTVLVLAFSARFASRVLRDILREQDPT